MSAAWMSGYVSDVAYTLGYYRELAPSFLNYVCVANGVEGLREGRRLRYCELGCGRGYGTTLLAAANPDIDFVGIDFNPTHIGEARDLADKCGLSNLTFLEMAFGDAAASNDKLLADFDVVGMHGVYTWVDLSVRRDIVNFLRTKLVPGGIAYISYNTYPGWAAATPIQHLLKQSADRHTGTTLTRLAKAQQTLVSLVQGDAAYVAQNPSVKSRIEGLAKQDAAYLAHEFLHENWEPIYVTEAFRDFGEAKLSYIGSASIGENRLSFSVPAKMVASIEAAPDLALREQLKDYAANKQFRRDVYVKGPIKLSAVQQKRRFDALTFYLTASFSQLPESWAIPAGQARMLPGLIEAIIERLKKGPATGGELDAVATAAGFPTSDVQQVMEILVHNNAALPGRGDWASLDRSATDRLNQAVLDLSLVDDTHKFLAAPALGSAVGTNFLERLALPVLLDNEGKDTAATAGLVFDRMEKADKRMTKDGRQLDRSNFDEVEKMVGGLQRQLLSRLREFGSVA